MNERQRTILSRLAEQKEIRVKHLIQTLGVSGVTVRQDLEYLQSQGFIERTHGGAVLRSEDEISHRLSINYEIKAAIAEQAAARIEPGETIFIEAGSANALLARRLLNESRLTVVTNNVFITRILKNSEVNVVLLGGIFQHQSECVVGRLAVRGLELINFSKTFLGVDGISPETGVTCSDMLRADVSSRAVSKSEKVFILTDSSKIGRTAMSQVCTLDHVNCLITDSAIPPRAKDAFEEAGIQVVISNP